MAEVVAEASIPNESTDDGRRDLYNFPCASNDVGLDWLITQSAFRNSNNTILGRGDVDDDDDDDDDGNVDTFSFIPCFEVEENIASTAITTSITTSTASTTTSTTAATMKTSTANTGTEPPASALSITKEEPKSFYSCSSGNDGSVGSDESNSSPPPGTTELSLTYDYELHTSSQFNRSSMLPSFEHGILRDLSSQFGLINCSEGVLGSDHHPQRRYLRSLKRERVVVALDSAPLDERLGDNYECEESVVDGIGAPTICTPMRGYMTAYITNTDYMVETEVQILALIEKGMRTNSYTNDVVIKVSYIGVRENVAAQEGSDLQHINTGNAENALDNTNGNVNPAMGSPNLNGVKLVEPGKLESNNLPFVVVIVISFIFLFAFALAIFLGVLFLRKNRVQLVHDGPSSDDDMSNAKVVPKPVATHNNAFAETPRVDPNDVQLLPSPDKLDMQSIYSDEMSTDLETEGHMHDNRDRKNKSVTASKYGNLYGGHYGDGGVDILRTLSGKMDGHRDLAAGADTAGDMRGSDRWNRTSGAGSSLAAMGVASTLAALSFSPRTGTDPASHADFPASPDDCPSPPSRETTADINATSNRMPPKAAGSQPDKEVTLGTTAVSSGSSGRGNSHGDTVEREASDTVVE